MAYLKKDIGVIKVVKDFSNDNLAELDHLTIEKRRNEG